MIDYTSLMIEKAREFTAKNGLLKNIIPQENIRSFYAPKEIVTPSVIIRTLQNAPRTFTKAQEAVTDFGFQVDVNCSITEVFGVGYTPDEACRIIIKEYASFFEKDLRLRRITVADPIPVDNANTIYSQYLRYGGKHYLLQNMIYK